MPLRIFSLLFLILISSQAYAVGLINRAAQVNGSLLPKGLWMISYDYGSSGRISNVYEEGGSRNSLQNSLSQNLKVSDLVKHAGSDFDKGLALSAFESYGLTASDDAGRVINHLDINYSSETLVLGRGVSESVSLFFIAPRIKMDVQLQSELKYSEKLLQMIQDLKSQGQFDKAREIEEKSKNVLKEQLQEYNYDPNLISHWEGVPQWILMARLQNQNMKKRGWSLETQLIIPNEEDVYIDQFVPVEFMEEAPSLKQSFYADLYKNDDWMVTGLASYQFRSAFQKDMRVPEETDFSNDKESLRVKYGNEWRLSLQTQRRLSSEWRAFANINYLEKARDSYEGKNFSEDRYKSLESGTDQQMLLAGIGVQADMIDAFLRKRFPIPVVMTAQYSKDLSGRNVFSNDYYSLNAMVFVK